MGDNEEGDTRLEGTLKETETDRERERESLLKAEMFLKPLAACLPETKTNKNKKHSENADTSTSVTFVM